MLELVEQRKARVNQPTVNQYSPVPPFEGCKLSPTLVPSPS